VKKLVTIVGIILVSVIVNMDILHNDLPYGRVWFSVVSSIETDISERQLLTPTFIKEILE
jgi:hypothetical protein